VQAFTVLMGESVADGHPAREWFAERYPRHRANLAAALRAGIDTGEIRPDVGCDASLPQRARVRRATRAWPGGHGDDVRRRPRLVRAG
jgi:hypothetical protein